MNGIKIRKMHIKDIEQIMKIESVSYGEFFWPYEAFVTEIQSDLAQYFVAVNDSGNVIGYAGYWLICDEAHITTIAVHPDYRRQGLGERLLQKMIDTGYEKSAKWFTLEVRASNLAAQNMYFKYNFKSLGLRKKYYQDNDEDAMIMWTENIWSSSFRESFEKLKCEQNERNAANNC